MDVNHNDQAPAYEPPAGVVLGHVADLTAGGTGSGSDALGASNDSPGSRSTFPS